MRGMDPRIARTHQALREALMELARERDVDEISVAEIAEVAGINRSTFYQHYRDKGVLLADVLDAVTQEAMESVTVDLGPAELRQVLLRYLTHVQANLTLYRRIFSDAVSSGVQARIRERLEGLLLSRTDHGQGEVAGLPFPVAAASITGAAVAIIAAWVQAEQPAPATQVAEWIWQMVRLHEALPDQS